MRLRDMARVALVPLTLLVSITACGTDGSDDPVIPDGGEPEMTLAPQADAWPADELDQAVLALATQGAVAEVVEDEEALAAAEDIGLAGARKAARCRRHDRDGVGVVIDFTDCDHAVGRIRITHRRDDNGPLYLFDFQDDFAYHGVEIRGHLDVRRGNDAGVFSVRSRPDADRRLTLRRRRGDHHVKALLLIAAVIAVKNDVIEVELPRDAARNGLTGDPSWGDSERHLGDRVVELFTGDGERRVLTFSREPGACACPQAGDLQLAGAFEDLELTLRDAVDGLSQDLGRGDIADAVVGAFEGFTFDLTTGVEGRLEASFSGACAEPAVEPRDLGAVRVPVTADNSVCPLPAGASVMARVGAVLDGLGAIENRGVVESRVRRYLESQADEDGCFTIDGPAIDRAVRARLAARLEQGICAAP